MPALATGQFMQYFCLHHVITHGISYNFIKFYLGMDNSRVAARLKIVYRFALSGGHV